MQAQAQHPGQVLTSLTTVVTPWQNPNSDEDIQLRRPVIERTYLIFQKYKNQLPSDLQQRIAELVQHVEEALYHEATSKDEYQDITTLEYRLQMTMPRFIQQQQRAPNSMDEFNRPMMIPTPGYDAPSMRTGAIPASTMIPVGNHNLSGGNGNVMFSTGGGNGMMNNYPVNGLHVLQNAQHPVTSGFTTGRMQMIPTPQQQQQAQFSKANDMGLTQFGNGHLIRQPGNGGQLKGPVSNGNGVSMLMNRNHLSNGAVHDPTAAAYSGLLHQQQQQRLNQQQRMQMSNASVNSSYAMNAADLAGYPKAEPQVLPQSQPQQPSPLPPPQIQQQQHQQHLQQRISGVQLQHAQRGTFQQNGMISNAAVNAFSDSVKETKVRSQSPSSLEQAQQPMPAEPEPQEPVVELQPVKQEPQLQPQGSPPVLSPTQQNGSSSDGLDGAEVGPRPSSDAAGRTEAWSPISAVSVQGGAQPGGNGVTTARVEQYRKQSRFLMFLLHARQCNPGDGRQCNYTPHCKTARILLDHVQRCRDRVNCPNTKCLSSFRLLAHFRSCRGPNCPVCLPVRHALLRMQQQQLQQQQQQPPPQSRQAEASPPGEQGPKRRRVEQAEVKPEVATTVNVKPERQADVKDVKKVEQVPHKQLVKNEPGSSGGVKPGNHKMPGGNTVVGTTRKGAKPKLGGVSLTEIFSPEQIRRHITSLRQWVGQSKTKAEKNQAMENQQNEHACPLCAVEKLCFEPPPIYCTTCGIRVKRNAFYYTTAVRETKHYLCVPCYNDVRAETVELEGQSYPKATFEKRKYDEEAEEPWVCCDKCNLWQHQICALFNGRRNEGGEAEYTCPHCCMAEMESGERASLPSSAVLGAKDLPRTLLSDHLEQRLEQKLRQERQERARVQGRTYNEVEGAEELVVRVVSSVDKKLEVKPRFLEIFQEEDYPSEFPYKSKAVLLFQRIEGVEVCLFGMYVQEFGVDSAQPNQRRVYLSYLDSVKYFRPEVRTLNGEALRTFVYHELLVGYLDYCKRRGFSSCYIWACPPLKGEDYILYCHPEIQKTPKSDKLREWYLTMLKKASRENIVAEVTNFYDFFFVSNGECKAKETAARLPYFDGDYWPGAAEDMILQLQQEDDDGSKQPRKGKVKKAPSKRATKAAAQAEMALNASKDGQLMSKLGDSIMPMKEDFIMVHMHYSCTHCRLFIVSGYRWVCRTCKVPFQLCDRCHDAELKLDERERHPANLKDVHQLAPIETSDVPSDTTDKDDIMESEFFDTRHSFLSLCQGNHYQYDTLRRAKHSSMMVLYHLHNPMAPAFVITCCMCNSDIESGQGWRCETCTDYDLCNACYQKDEARKHPHKLVPHPSAADRNAQNKEARQQRVLQLRKMLGLLVHASQCNTSAQQCQYPNCGDVKRLFRHGMTCQKRAVGGCTMCKKMWYFMQLHARSCKQLHCRVPRCKDLKDHLRKVQHQMESRRRAAVMEMMRQRAAETAGRK